MNELRLPDTTEYTFINKYRHYVIFTRQKLPVWTPLVKMGIRHYQKSPVTYTHSIFVTQDMLTQTLYWHETSIWSGMDVYTVDYEQVKYDSSKLILAVTQENHYGLLTTTEYIAVDVTQRITHDVESLWWRCLTDVRLTPFTLLRHILGLHPVTWTCSGLTSALLGLPRDVSYLAPMSPDQLLSYLTESN